ncbi:MAG: FlgD immunoglobulin-like domain containing protein, partial [candidate division WOR-3 bacterium]
TSPVAGALVCLNKGAETYASGYTNSQGWVELRISPSTSGNLDYCITAQNCYPARGRIVVTGTSTAPALEYAGCRILDGDGRLDPGETIDMCVSVRNTGSASATGTTVRLQSLSPLVQILDSVSYLGTVAVGDSVESGKLRVAISDSAPRGARAEFALACSSAQGSWSPSFSLQIGESGPRYRLWSDHDVGNMILSVTSVGSIGTLGPYREGSGLKYPRNAGYGSLYFTSLACGNGPDYVVDRWYGQPTSTWNQDWRILDTLHSISPIATDQEYQATFDDNGHSAPKGLTVAQWSGSSRRMPYQDFVIISYTLTNRGNQPINGLYVGIMSDFDISNLTRNDVYSDAGRRLIYMTPASSYDPSVGIKLLNPSTAANLSAIDHSVYVQPARMMTEAVKDSFLRGAISRPNSNRSDNWSCMVSAGPFDLAPGAAQKVAFALVGGEGRAELLAHADSAQSFFDRQIPAGITYLRSIVDDAPPGGNGDGTINPGESINLPVWVVNRSDRSAHGVWGMLHAISGETLVAVTDSIRYFGHVGPGDSATTGSNGFRFSVAQACTNGYYLPLSLVCHDTLESVFTSLPPLRVGATQLVPVNIQVWDQAHGNGNGRLDPNERAEIAIGLANTGETRAEQVTVRLRSSDTRLTILDSVGFYGSIAPDSVVLNESDRFEVQVGSVQPETQLPCTLEVQGTDYHVLRTVSLEAGILTASDPIPDGPRQPAVYYAYDDCDSLYVGHPVYDWIELRNRGTRLDLGDDETRTVQLPAAFGPFYYYGQRHTAVSISSNGFVIPGASSYAQWQNSQLPSPKSPSLIAGLWDDLYPPSGRGIWYAYDSSARAFVVEWDSVPHLSNGTFERFEIVILDTTFSEPGLILNPILTQYQTASYLASSTIGIQDSTGTIGVQCLYDGQLHRGAAQVTAGRAIAYRAGLPTVGQTQTLRPANRSNLSLAGQPNPLRTAARVRFSLPSQGRVRLTIHDMTGRRIRTVLDAALEPGSHTVTWHRDDDQGRNVPSGVYAYRLETETGSLFLKAVVLD